MQQCKLTEKYWFMWKPTAKKHSLNTVDKKGLRNTAVGNT